MTDRIVIIALGDRCAWEAEHSVGGLPSQSWSYAWALSASGVTPKLAVVCTGSARMLMVFFEREWRGTTDIATVFGLSGASILPNSAAPLGLWREFATAQCWVAGYIQLATSTELASETVNGDLVTSNVVFELSLGAGSILDLASRTVRRKVHDATAAGTVLIDDPVLLSESLQRLYPATMQRVGAGPQNAFSPTTLERWALDEESLVLGAMRGGSIEAVYLFRIAGRHAESHILGTTEPGRDMIAWLICEGAARLRQRGVTTLNLGGGVRPGDGIYRFKQRFNGTAKPLRAVRQIYDKIRYDELCRHAGVGPEGAGWFPAYRAGSVTSSGRRGG